MNAVETDLPEAFAALAPFAAQWGVLDTMEARFSLRQRSSQAELQAFYDVAAPLLPAIFAHLDKFPLGSLPPAESRLFAIALGLTEAAEAVEIFGQPIPPGAADEVPINVTWTRYGPSA